MFFTEPRGERREWCQASLLRVSEKSCRSYRRSLRRTTPAPHGPGRVAAGSRPCSETGWALAGSPRSPLPQTKAEGFAEEPPRLLLQSASLTPENSNQNKITITPTLFSFFPRQCLGTGRSAVPGGLTQGPGGLPPGAADSGHSGAEQSPLSSERSSRADGAEPAAKEWGRRGGLTVRLCLPGRRRPRCPPRSPASPPQAPAGLPVQPVHPGAVPESSLSYARQRRAVFGFRPQRTSSATCNRPSARHPRGKPWLSGSAELPPPPKPLPVAFGFSLVCHPVLGPLQAPSFLPGRRGDEVSSWGIRLPPPPLPVSGHSAAPTLQCSPGGRRTARPLPGSPGLVTFGEDGSHFQVAGGEADDRRLVQLRGDGRRQGQEFGQFVEFSIFFFPSSLCRVLGFFLHRDYCKAKMTLAY